MEIHEDSVTEIERDAFKGCSSLELLTMPAKLVTLGRGAFQGSSLQHLAIPSFVDMILSVVNSYIYIYIVKYIYIYIYSISILCGREGFTLKLNQPKKVAKFTELRIWPLTFDSCKSLLSVTLGHSVGLIEPEAFSSCSLLESLALSAAVCYIGQRAFRGCSSLRSVTIEQTAPPPIQELRAVNARRRCVASLQVLPFVLSSKAKSQESSKLLTLKPGCGSNIGTQNGTLVNGDMDLGTCGPFSGGFM